MPQMVAALFQRRAAAEQALQALIGSGVARDRISLLGEDSGREVSSISGFRDLQRDDDHAALADLPLPEDDRRTFAVGLRHGCALVAARIEREQMDEAIEILEMFDPLDLDRRSEAWQSEDEHSGADLGGPLAAGLTGGSPLGQTNTGAVPGAGALTGSDHDVGSADLRADEGARAPIGQQSTTVTARALDRTERAGVLDLGGPLSRDLNLAGRVRAYHGD
jgi:hypothetical protein